MSNRSLFRKGLCSESQVSCVTSKFKIEREIFSTGIGNRDRLN
jgi:hypothetical protein